MVRHPFLVWKTEGSSPSTPNADLLHIINYTITFTYLIVIVLVVHNEQNLAVRNILGVIQTHTETIKVLLETPPSQSSPLVDPVNINLIPSILLGSILFGFIFMGYFYFDFGDIGTCLDTIKALIENKGNSIIRFITEIFSVSQESSNEKTSSLLKVLTEIESNRLKDTSRVIERLDSLHLDSASISSTEDQMNTMDLGDLLKDAD